MDDATSRADDASARPAAPADELISLIMSGQKPALGESRAPEAGAARAAARTNAGGVWADPPDETQVPQPRVEAPPVRVDEGYRAPVAPRVVETPTARPRFALTTPPPADHELVPIPGVEPLGDAPPRRHQRVVRVPRRLGNRH